MQKLHETRSLCPICLKPISAELLDKDGKVYMVKSCAEHGDFEDVYWGSRDHYDWLRASQVGTDKVRLPTTKRDKGCPFDCGLCDEHKANTAIYILDVTNRCNLKCPICFANSGAEGDCYEPSCQEIMRILKGFRNREPSLTPTLQLSGGEATLRDDLPDIVCMAKDLGFLRVEVNTNGIRIAKDLDYTASLQKVGTDIVGLQFDGVANEIYERIRGIPLFEVKLKAIKNLRKIGLNVALVVTLVKGINEHQMGDIIRFAIENIDVIKRINIQTIAFAGRASSANIKNERITSSELVRLIEEQTHRAKHGIMKGLYKLKIQFTLLREASSQIKSPIFRDLLFTALKGGQYDPLADMDNVLMIGCENYMDVWNFDTEKVETCPVHYVTPDGRSIPFCSYNILYRDKMA